MQYGEVAATLSYNDYRNFDFPLSGFGINSGLILNSDNVGGMTIGVRISGIPRMSGDKYNTCYLAVSFGDPNGGPRVGRILHFGPGFDFEIPADGILVLQVTIGIVDTFFGVVGGSGINIPVGLAGGTVAGYFGPGSLPTNVTYSGTVYVMAGDSSATPPDPSTLTVPPQNLTYISNTNNGSDQGEFTFEFDYPGGEPGGISYFELWGLPEGGGLPSFGDVNFTNGVTHYSVTTDLGNVNLQVRRQFYVYAVRLGTPNLYSEPAGVFIYPGVASNTFLFTPNFTFQLNPAIVGTPSGIYKLTANKRHDTIFRHLPGLDTEDVKIPTPFVKTALFP